ncbi:MAG: BlaI/MecI/CopY family transcriptional regulator [Longimicrobiales bacterium]
MKVHQDLSRRERQIMDVVYARGHATAAEVQEGLPDPPSYSAVRAMLRKLERKGHLEHVADGPRYVFEPTLPRETARQGALERLMGTFFEGSAAKTVAALLDRHSAELTDAELDRLAGLIERARRVER